jgi:hypothetical protein
MKNPLFKKTEDVLNAIFILLFLMVFGIVIFILSQRQVLPRRIDVFDFFLLSFATFRLIRFVTYDKITNFIREYFHSADQPLSRTIYELLICPWCTGIWAALVTLPLFYFFSFGWLSILLLAIAGLASSMQIITNSIIRYAEKSILERELLESKKK